MAHRAHAAFLPRDEFRCGAGGALPAPGGHGLAVRTSGRAQRPQQQIVAVMPVPAAAVETVRRQFRPADTFHHPAAHAAQIHGTDRVVLPCGDAVLYWVYDTLLRLAEAIEAPGDADLLCAARTADARVSGRALRGGGRGRRAAQAAPPPATLFPQTSDMRIISGKHRGRTNRAAAQPPGTSHDGLRQGEPVQCAEQPPRLRGDRRAGPLRRLGVDRLRIRLGAVRAA